MLAIAALCALSGALALTGEIAFVDTAAGEGGAVCMISLEESAIRQVGPGRNDGPPRWSPDGAWLAFETKTDTGRALHVVRADGAEGRTVGASTWCTAPAWSTDATRLVYVSATKAGIPGELRVLDLTTGEDTVWGNGAAGLVHPIWMPFTLLMRNLDPNLSLEVDGVDMQRLRNEAHMGDDDLKSGIPPDAVLAIRLAPDLSSDRPSVHTEIVLVTRTEIFPLLRVVDKARAEEDAVLWGLTPNWRKYRFASESTAGTFFGAHALAKSGETTRIAFESNEGGDREILLLGKRGIANVSNHRAADWNPVWAPDGDNVAFESFRSGRRGIYNVYADTAHVSPIAVMTGADCWSPAWSPDGEGIAFVADPSGQAELYVTSQKDAAPVQLTFEGGPKAAPVWRPVSP